MKSRQGNHIYSHSHLYNGTLGLCFAWYSFWLVSTVLPQNTYCVDGILVFVKDIQETLSFHNALFIQKHTLTMNLAFYTVTHTQTRRFAILSFWAQLTFDILFYFRYVITCVYVYRISYKYRVEIKKIQCYGITGNSIIVIIMLRQSFRLGHNTIYFIFCLHHSFSIIDLVSFS